MNRDRPARAQGTAETNPTATQFPNRAYAAGWGSGKGRCRAHRTGPAFAAGLWGGMVLAGAALSPLPTGAAAADSPFGWQPEVASRSAVVRLERNATPGFVLLPPNTTGIAFTNFLPAQRHLTNQILLNGSGVAAGDVDGDGWCDLYFCGLDRPNALYRNLGQWRFQDITATAGVACAGLDATGAAFADLDGDADLDLVVNSLGQGTHIFFNDGAGRFDRTLPPLNAGKGGMSLALGDVDGDGFLDLYVANYRTSALMDLPNTRFWFKEVNGRRVVDRVNGRPVTDPAWANRFVVSDRGSIEELGEPDVLFLNQGGTNFVPVPFTGGGFLDEDGRPLTAPLFEWGLSVMFRDVNRDGAPDLYVCNDFDSPDRLWLNEGWGRFRAAPRRAFRQTGLFSMSLDWADLNRDGHDDLVALDMLNRDRVARLTTMSDRKPPLYVPGELDHRPQYMRTVLQLNRGDGTFAELGQFSGLAASDWAWNVAALDVDLDGWEDLLVANGNERDARNMDVADALRALRTQRQMSPAEILQARTLFPLFHTANRAFRNRPDAPFEEVGATWGFNLVGVSHGLALADLDNDGDFDVVLNNLNAPASLLRNRSGAPRVAVRLKGLPPNTQGIGARITLTGGGLPEQSQEIMAGGRYLSSDEALRVFAAGTPGKELRLAVRWRSGRRSLLPGIRPNRIYEVYETGAVELHGPQPAGPLRRGPPHFEDISQRLDHVHEDAPFNDFERQPLLPKRLSGLGPGVAWFDVNGDDWDDLIVGSGQGGRMAVFLNDQRGGFTRAAWPVLNPPVPRDQTAVLAWRDATGRAALLAGMANYEEAATTAGGVRKISSAGNESAEVVPGSASSTGPMALADVDGDGILDLFVGGRVVPGQYPADANSRVFRGTAAGFALDAVNTRALAGAGLVSGAVFSDLDADGDPDLVLACEWGPVRVFRNDRGQLAEATQSSGLAELRGWWNGVATGDFDGDGALDIVASNWGRNTPYEAFRAQPLQVFYGDLDGNGTFEVIETHYDADLGKWVPDQGLNLMAGAVPYLKATWTTHQDYALASVREVFGENLGRAKVRQANWLESTVFINRGGRFEARPLPSEAQWAPAFAVCVGDYDNDGHEDIFLSQNFFAVATGRGRYDAGRGLWLRGDGRGGFAAVPGDVSGIRIYGEQRGAALADYDRDGRVDVVVAQHAAATRLYRNVGAPAGVRIVLKGAAGNPDAIGATLRLVRDGQPGPAREIQAGSGYWSQNSPAHVFARPAGPAHVWVRWPGGKVTQSALPTHWGHISTFDIWQ